MIASTEPQPGAWGYDNGFQLRSLPSDKFDVTEVLAVAGPEHFVIKTTGDPAAQADLGNSVAWNTWISAQHPTSFDVPRTTARISRNGAGQIIAQTAHISWVEGEIIDEERLMELAPRYADIIHELTGMQVDWAGDPASWVHRKLQTAGAIALDAITDSTMVGKLRGIIDSGLADIARPGVVHGDLAPKNGIMDKEGRLWLLDAEFGTHGDRPAFAVPRTRDAAYLLHLLYCQFQQPETADELYSELTSRFAEDSTWEEEFWLATLERTLTMYKLFVVDQPRGNGIDSRRLDPTPYVRLLGIVAERLAAQ